MAVNADTTAIPTPRPVPGKRKRVRHEQVILLHKFIFFLNEKMVSPPEALLAWKNNSLGFIEAVHQW